MALFQSSVLKKHLRLQDSEVISKAYKKYVKYFLNPTIQENIRNSKEEQFQATFLTELFVNILGYTLNPNPKFNLTTEFKNQKNARKADGAILNDESAIGVIELKGTNTKDLESIRKQAFDYKANQKGCVYVVTSNFEKLRFYINDATEFEEFNLFELSEIDFQLLYLCLYKDNVLTHKPLSIKEASIVEEEQITKSFYKDYSLFKRELYRDLVKQNGTRLKSEARETLKDFATDDALKNELERIEKNVKLSLFKKSQKLIDRFLFVFFAEDRGLLPPNSTVQILNKWKADVDFGDERPVYDLFKQYFNFLDQGRKGTTSRAEIYAYNGGLFKPDNILDNLVINNELLFKYTLKLANYDFESQVDVNILGHIFENSLNEIESINAEIEGEDFVKQTSKRKKDGVFYTPKYITKYIVENTIGKLCYEKKQELGFDEEQYFKGRKNRNKTTIEKLVTILDDYREWLLRLTICDPACGSGAFLNQALDFLIKEHSYIDELKTKILGGGFQFPDIENTILENNIYGVDINEESVEIAKLSLWLRTAQPRRKLNDLSGNIKCGNSLIDSKTGAGDKAFNWESAFSKVFKGGGFNVVIGNPPYVQIRTLEKEKIGLSVGGFKTFTSMGDLYCLFYEKGIQILKNKGLLGFITSNTWMTAKYGAKLRSYLVTYSKPFLLIDLGSDVFDSAQVESNLLFTEKVEIPLVNLKALKLDQKNKNFEDIENQEIFNLSFEAPNDEPWILINRRQNNIKQKIESIGVPLKDWNLQFYRGIQTGNNSAFIIDEKLKYQLIKADAASNEIIYPTLHGKNIKRYSIDDENEYLIYLTNETDLSKYPAVQAHLSQFKDSLKKKKEVQENKMKWFSIYRPALKHFHKFKSKKIIFSKASKEQAFYFDDEAKYVNLNTSYFVTGDNLLSILAVLNSKFTRYNFINFYQSGGIEGEITIQSIENIPIPKIGEQLNKDLSEKSKLLNRFYKEFGNSRASFNRYLIKSLKLLKLPRKLENCQDLEFVEFIKELKKSIKTNNKTLLSEDKEPIQSLTKKDEFEWMELFEENKKKAQEFQFQIASAEKEIDLMVYDLYGLTEEEIMIVENS